MFLQQRVLCCRREPSWWCVHRKRKSRSQSKARPPSTLLPGKQRPKKVPRRSCDFDCCSPSEWERGKTQRKCKSRARWLSVMVLLASALVTESMTDGRLSTIGAGFWRTFDVTVIAIILAPMHRLVYTDTSSTDINYSPSTKHKHASHPTSPRQASDSDSAEENGSSSSDENMGNDLRRLLHS